MSDDIEDAELVPIVLSKETVKCFSCKHFNDSGDQEDKAYTFPCIGTTIATHGPLPQRFTCNAEPSNPNWLIYTVPDPADNTQPIPDVIECRNYESHEVNIEMLYPNSDLHEEE